MGMVKKIVWLGYKSCLFHRFGGMKSGYGMEALMHSYYMDFKKHVLPYSEIHKIHSRGFCVDDWLYLPVNENNYKDYLSSAQYFSMHPMNGQYSKWIDDKLTLKYMCAGTELDQYLPKYYFQITETGKILPLPDYSSSLAEVSVTDIIKCLTQERVLAVKQVAGSLGVGFYKIEFSDERYWVNGEPKTLIEMEAFLGGLHNYIVLEYLRPHAEIAKYCPDTTNTIRYLYGRVNGTNQMLKGFVRFGTKKSGFVENYNAGGVLCYLDENGRFHHGNMLDREHHTNLSVKEHPDSHVVLDSEIPMWDEIQKAVDKFAVHFPQLVYLGFDFVVTDQAKVKLLEINSLTSLDSLQIDGSILQSENGGFFRNQLKR